MALTSGQKRSAPSPPFASPSELPPSAQRQRKTSPVLALGAGETNPFGTTPTHRFSPYDRKPPPPEPNPNPDPDSNPNPDPNPSL